MALTVRCIRCGGPHLVWQCPEARAATRELIEGVVPQGLEGVVAERMLRTLPQPESGTTRFDKTAYQREYMRQRRAAARKGEKYGRREQEEGPPERSLDQP